MEKVVFYKSKWFVNLFFAIFTVLFFVSFVWTIFVHQNDFNIPLLGRKFADARINFEMDESLLKNVHLMSGKIELDPYIMQTKNSYITYENPKTPLSEDVVNFFERMRSLSNDTFYNNMYKYQGNKANWFENININLIIKQKEKKNLYYIK